MNKRSLSTQQRVNCGERKPQEVTIFTRRDAIFFVVVVGQLTQHSLISPASEYFLRVGGDMLFIHGIIYGGGAKS